MAFICIGPSIADNDATCLLFFVPSKLLFLSMKHHSTIYTSSTKPIVILITSLNILFPFGSF